MKQIETNIDVLETSVISHPIDTSRDEPDIWDHHYAQQTPQTSPHCLNDKPYQEYEYPMTQIDTPIMNMNTASFGSEEKLSKANSQRSSHRLIQNLDKEEDL